MKILRYLFFVLVLLPAINCGAYSYIAGVSGVERGDTYFVATTGNDTNAGTQGSPWLTITKANTVLTAGDTVYIKGGTYTGQQVAPANSGSGNQRIIYRNYDNETVIVTTVGTAVVLDSRSRVTVLGINFENIDVFGSIIGGNYNEIKRCTFDQMRTYEEWVGLWIGVNSSYNKVRNSTLSRYGEFIAGPTDRGDMIFIGKGTGNGTNSHNVIENNHMFFSGHSLINIYSPYNVIRNNYFHNEEWFDLSGTLYGNRCIEIYGEVGGNYNIIEDNRFSFSGIPNDASYAAGIQLRAHDTILRRNVFYANKGPGIRLEASGDIVPPMADDNYIYHNVFFYNGLVVSDTPTSVNAGVSISGGTGAVTNTVIKNNIFYLNKNSATISEINTVVDTVDSNNLKNTDPVFNAANIDYLSSHVENLCFPSEPTVAELGTSANVSDDVAFNTFARSIAIPANSVRSRALMTHGDLSASLGETRSVALYVEMLDALGVPVLTQSVDANSDFTIQIQNRSAGTTVDRIEHIEGNVYRIYASRVLTAHTDARWGIDQDVSNRQRPFRVGGYQFENALSVVAPYIKTTTAAVTVANKFYPDFGLQVTSTAIDTGGFLTQTVDSGTAVSVIPVADARYFTAGLGLINGDVIRIEDQSVDLRVTEVDYTNHLLYVSPPATFATAKGVSLTFNGTAPDIGAVEYN